MDEHIPKAELKALLESVECLFVTNATIQFVVLLEELIKFCAAAGTTVNERVDMLLANAEQTDLVNCDLDRDQCLVIIEGVVSPSSHIDDSIHLPDDQQNQHYRNSSTKDPVLIQLFTPQRPPFGASLAQSTLQNEINPALFSFHKSSMSSSFLPKSSRLKPPPNQKQSQQSDSNSYQEQFHSLPTPHINQHAQNFGGDLITFDSPQASHIVANANEKSDDVPTTENALDRYFVASTPPPGNSINAPYHSVTSSSQNQRQQEQRLTGGQNPSLTQKRSVTPSKIPLNTSRLSPRSTHAQKSSSKPEQVHTHGEIQATVDSSPRQNRSRHTDVRMENEFALLQRSVRDGVRKTEDMERAQTLLEQELDAAQNDLKQSQRKYQQKREELSVMKKTEKEYLVRIKELEPMVKKLEQAVTMHQDSINELKRKLKESRDTNDQYQAQLEAKEEQLLRTKSELDEKVAQLASAIQERDHIASTVNEAQHHLAETDRLQEAFNHLKNENDNLHTIIARLESERDHRFKQYTTTDAITGDTPPLLRHLSLSEELAAIKGEPIHKDNQLQSHLLPPPSLHSALAQNDRINIADVVHTLEKTLLVLPRARKDLIGPLNNVFRWAQEMQQQQQQYQLPSPSASITTMILEKQHSNEPRRSFDVCVQQTQTVLSADNIESLFESEDMLRIFQADAQTSAIENVRWQEERLAMQTTIDELRETIERHKSHINQLTQQMQTQKQTLPSILRRPSNSLSKTTTNQKADTAINSTPARRQSVTISVAPTPIFDRQSSSEYPFIEHVEKKQQSELPKLSEPSSDVPEKSMPDESIINTNSIRKTTIHQMQRLRLLYRTSFALPVAFFVLLSALLIQLYVTPFLSSTVTNKHHQTTSTTNNNKPIPQHDTLHKDVTSKVPTFTPLPQQPSSSHPPSSHPQPSHQPPASFTMRPFNPEIDSTWDDTPSWYQHSNPVSSSPSQHWYPAHNSWSSSLAMFAHTLKQPLENMIVAAVDTLSGTDSTQWNEALGVPS